jgi:hypothetical protein
MGSDPRQVRSIVAQLYDRVSNEGGHVHRTAFSGIELACWDIPAAPGLEVDLDVEAAQAHPYDAEAYITSAGWEQRLGSRERLVEGEH